MATIIEMPKLSDTMTVGTVASWLKNEGDEIESGDVIAEIETDKATMELEAFEDGVLLKQIAKAGEQVPIGGPIAAIGEEGEEFDESSVSKPEAPEAESDDDADEEGDDEDDETESTEEENESAGEDEEEDSKAAATDDSKADKETYAKKSMPSTKDEPAKKSGKRLKISPLARKLADEKGIDPTTIKGSGPNGRIVKADILAAKKSAKGSPSGKGSEQLGIPLASDAGVADEKDIPVSNMRSIIAKRLVESKRDVPHFYLEAEYDMAPLLAMRQQVNAELGQLSPEAGAMKFTVNDFILKASVEALRRVPAMNRSWNGKTIRQHSSVNLSFGVALDDGLLTPVIRSADAKSLKRIATEARELIEKARSKKLSPDEMSGSTFTVTNLGMYGVTSFYGIINPPNAGILSVGATIAKPVIDNDGQIVPGQRITIGLSGDHRVVDGAVGAQFLQALRAVIETPALILL